MRYTKEERLEIGRMVYEGTMSRYEATEAYGISRDSARDYMRLYRDYNDYNSLPPNHPGIRQNVMSANLPNLGLISQAMRL